MGQSLEMAPRPQNRLWKTPFNYPPETTTMFRSLQTAAEGRPSRFGEGGRSGRVPMGGL